MLGKALTTAAAGSAGAASGLGIEDVFSTYLYTANGSTQTLTNGIDLAGEGGMVWCKRRDGGSHGIFDTERGIYKILYPSYAYGEDNLTTTVTAFNSDGFSTGAQGIVNASSINYASWTFRKAPGFFDVVTYTGNSTAGRTISHNLGSTPGFIITKRVDGTANWLCYHRSLGFGNGTDSDTNYIVLNSDSASNGFGTAGVIVAADSSTFTPGASANFSGATYVAYIFAHDEQIFGENGNESVIQCGSYTGNGSSTAGPIVNLGWEPQWLMIKNTSTAGTYWTIVDNMRGFSYGENKWLYPNTTDAEGTATQTIIPLATGFQVNNVGTFVNSSGSNYIYIAIRRGPMKTPTDATKVFSAQAPGTNGTGFSPIINDMVISGFRNTGGSTSTWQVVDRLRGALAPFPSYTTGATAPNPFIKTDTTDVETTSGCRIGAIPFTSGGNGNVFPIVIPDGGFVTNGHVDYFFRRAPGFFDVVAYSADGFGFSQTINHNLGVVPELIIVKHRSGGSFGNTDWLVYSASLGNASGLSLNLTSNSFSTNAWGIEYSSPPTSTQITLGNYVSSVNGANGKYVGYLFATLSGVSKVGSYTGTGTGTTQQIDCGFAAGARFVLIKRTDSTGDWYVWDTARGIVSGNDPYLLLNSAAAEVTTTDYIDPYSAGFEISSSAPAAINASGGDFIFLAIA
jgi:hypothetical protein